jgi:hypothetical protein
MTHRSISGVLLRVSLVVALSLAAFACKKGGDARPGRGAGTPTPTQQPAQTPPGGEAPGTPPPPGDDTPPGARRFDAAGLTVTANADGTIRLTGQDRWQNQIDTTYADTTYLRNALPVVERTVSEAQGRALRAVLDQLTPDAGAE